MAALAIESGVVAERRMYVAGEAIVSQVVPGVVLPPDLFGGCA